jgi:SSS family solute:Na+ symporter
MDSYTRTFAARDAVTAKRGVLLAALFLIPLAVGASWLGMTSAILFPGLEDSSDILSTFVLESFPVGLKGLVLVGILAALMSTADICILTASANLSQDVYQRYINPSVSQHKLFQLSIGLSVVIGAVAALMAWRMQDIIDILLVGFTINSAALFLPSIAAVYFARANSRAAFWSIALSLLTVVIWYGLGRSEAGVPYGMDPLWPGLAVSFVAFSILNSRKETDR